MKIIQITDKEFWLKDNSFIAHFDEMCLVRKQFICIISNFLIPLLRNYWYSSTFTLEKSFCHQLKVLKCRQVFSVSSHFNCVNESHDFIKILLN